MYSVGAGAVCQCIEQEQEWLWATNVQYPRNVQSRSRSFLSVYRAGTGVVMGYLCTAPQYGTEQEQELLDSVQSRSRWLWATMCKTLYCTEQEQELLASVQRRSRCGYMGYPCTVQYPSTVQSRSRSF
jgi:hypothetical protein